jgi:hypothetical protein
VADLRPFSSGLECAECHGRVAEAGATALGWRCPDCGGQVLAPPGLLDRRSVRVGIYTILGLLFAAFALAQWGMYLVSFLTPALAFFGLSPVDIGRSEQRETSMALVRQAERTVPAVPGAEVVGERSGLNQLGTAPLVESCWHVPGVASGPSPSLTLGAASGRTPDVSADTAADPSPTAFDDVLAHYQDVLPAQGWRLLRANDGQATLGAQLGQVRLLVLRPDSAGTSIACPETTTYVLSFTLTRTSR